MVRPAQQGLRGGKLVRALGHDLGAQPSSFPHGRGTDDLGALAEIVIFEAYLVASCPLAGNQETNLHPIEQTLLLDNEHRLLGCPHAVQDEDSARKNSQLFFMPFFHGPFLG